MTKKNDDDLGICRHCDTPAAMCLYWKINGYVACCPECTHGQKPKSNPEGER